MSALKKPKTEDVEIIDGGGEQAANKVKMAEEENGYPDSRQEQEEALVALIEHRTREVHHLRNRVSYYKTQVAPHHPPLSLLFLVSFNGDILGFFFVNVGLLVCLFSFRVLLLL